MRRPCSRACCSSAASSLRPTPSPRADGATHIRLISVGRAAVELQRAAADRLHAQRATRSTPAGGAQFVGVGGDAPRRIEARVEARAELGEVRVEANRASGRRDPSGRSRPGARSGAARRRASRRRGAPAAARRAVRGTRRRARRCVVEHRSFAAAGAVRRAGAHPLIGGVRPDRDKARALRACGARGSGSRSRGRAATAARGRRAPSGPISHSSRASPSGRPRRRNWSCSTPSSWVTVRLNRRTSEMVRDPSSDLSQRMLRCAIPTCSSPGRAPLWTDERVINRKCTALRIFRCTGPATDTRSHVHQPGSHPRSPGSTRARAGGLA